MASLIAILDLKGKPLIQRSYRDDVPSSYIERFLPLVLDFEEEGQQVTPCFSSQGINYMHIRHSNLYSMYYTTSTIYNLPGRASSGTVETKLQCRRNHSLPTSANQRAGRILQRTGGGEYTR